MMLDDVICDLRTERELHAITAHELHLERVECARLRSLHAELSRQLAKTGHHLIAATRRPDPRALELPAETTQDRLDRWSRQLAAYKIQGDLVFDVSDALPVVQLPIDDGGR